MKSICLVATVLVVSLALASAAQAHIEIKPKRAPAGERASLRFVVENESATAGTRKIDVKLPQGITAVSPRSVRGWRVKLRRSGTQIARLIFTAPAGKEIPAGHTHRTFSFSMELPNRGGQRLAFKALQTYEDGTIQRWIGPRGSEMPAPTVRLTAAKAPKESEPQAQPSGDNPAGSGTAEGDGGDGGGSGALIAGVAVGAVVVVTAGVIWSRRRRTP